MEKWELLIKRNNIRRGNNFLDFQFHRDFLSLFINSHDKIIKMEIS